MQRVRILRAGKPTSFIAAAALAALTVACSNTAEGVKEDASELKRDAQETTADAQDATRGAGEAAVDAANRASDSVTGAIDNAGRAGDAAMETFDVKAALLADSRVDSSDINVDTDHTTRTVVLKGSVPTMAQKTLAGQIATEKAVGYHVDNRLSVAAR